MIELVRRHVFRSRDQARLAVLDYIEQFYNPIRARSSVGNLSPDEHEAGYHPNQRPEKPPQPVTTRPGQAQFQSTPSDYPALTYRG